MTTSYCFRALLWLLSDANSIWHWHPQSGLECRIVGTSRSQVGDGEEEGDEIGRADDERSRRGRIHLQAQIGAANVVQATA